MGVSTKSEWYADADSFARLQAAIQKYGDCAEKVLHDYLDEHAGENIAEKIRMFLPMSGKTWKNKARAARLLPVSSVFTSETNLLEVTVKSRKKYNYLYFPDDGSNTRRHFGNQRFMLAGAEAAENEILDGAIEALLEELEEVLSNGL